MKAAGNYEAWLNDVEAALSSINMPIDEWQGNWYFDFEAEFNAGAAPKDAAMTDESILVASAEQNYRQRLPQESKLLASARSLGRVSAMLVRSRS